MPDLFEIISEDEDFLVINKPAGLVCHPTKGDVYSSLISRVRLYLKTEGAPHMINRLDRETSGVVFIAKHLGAAVKLRQLWETRLVSKEYLAIVHGHLSQARMIISAALGKDPRSRVAIKDAVVPGGVEAETHVTLQKIFERDGKPFSRVRVTPLSGRKHQIRIHLSHIGHPIVGDKLYGGDEELYLAFVEGRLTPEQSTALMTPHHALHAATVRFEWFGSHRAFSCKPEKWFSDFAGISA